MFTGKRLSDGVYGFFLTVDGIDPCVEISDEEHKNLFEGQANGKQIYWHDDGTPYLDDPPSSPEDAARNRIEELKAEIAARDYRALKAFKLGKPLDELYPGETAWYENTIAEIIELESTLNGDAETE
jgi:hypothetical protein